MFDRFRTDYADADPAPWHNVVNADYWGPHFGKSPEEYAFNEKLTARLALVLAYLNWSADEAEEPHAITGQHFRQAAHLVEAYLVPMARRAYADAATPKAARAARRLVGILRQEGWQRFTARDMLRLDRSGLGKVEELNPALAMLEDGECIRPVDPPSNPQGGRPQRLFLVNPALHGG